MTNLFSSTFLLTARSEAKIRSFDVGNVAWELRMLKLFDTLMLTEYVAIEHRQGRRYPNKNALTCGFHHWIRQRHITAARRQEAAKTTRRTGEWGHVHGAEVVDAFGSI